MQVLYEVASETSLAFTNSCLAAVFELWEMGRMISSLTALPQNHNTLNRILVGGRLCIPRFGVVH